MVMGLIKVVRTDFAYDHILSAEILNIDGKNANQRLREACRLYRIEKHQFCNAWHQIYPPPLTFRVTVLKQAWNSNDIIPSVTLVKHK